MPLIVSERFCCCPRDVRSHRDRGRKMQRRKPSQEVVLNDRLRRARLKIRLYVNDRLTIDARHQRRRGVRYELGDVADVRDRAAVAAQRYFAYRTQRRLKGRRIDHLHVLRAARRYRTASQAFRRMRRGSPRPLDRCSRSSARVTFRSNSMSICGATCSAEVFTLSVPGVWRSASRDLLRIFIGIIRRSRSPDNRSAVRCLRPCRLPESRRLSPSTRLDWRSAQQTRAQNVGWMLSVLV